MLNESHQNISIKESLIFCLLSGLFIYAVCSIPCLHLYLFPPKNDGGIDFVMACLQPPNKYAFIISFSFFIPIGIWILRKAYFQNRSVYFVILALILAIGGGFLTGALETIYYVFIIGNSSVEEYFGATLDENYYGFKYSIAWTIAFTVIEFFFTAIFLTISVLIAKFKNRNSLK
jgi:hypothetical protein